MMMLLIVSFLLLLCQHVDGFASWMTTDFCRRTLQVGEIIMGEEVLLSEDRWVEVYRGPVALKSNQDLAIPGESLLVKINNPSNQFVYEVRGNRDAKFLKGGCDGKRVADQKETLLEIPATNRDNIEIVAAWAEGFSVVRVSNPFVLLLSNVDHSPIQNSSSSDSSLSNLRRGSKRSEIPHAKSKKYFALLRVV